MPAAAALVLLALALAAALAVRPWRLLRGGRLVTPLAAACVLVPWLWAWPQLAAMPIPLQWSVAPLAVLTLGWPLAVPVLAFAGLSTIATTVATVAEALVLTAWAGLLPATATLVLGHAVRLACGPHPVGYILGRAFLVPLVALAGCSFAAAALGQGLQAPAGVQTAATLLLAIGEASWTCAIASLLVACRPQWLATWSDALYLPARVKLRARR